MEGEKYGIEENSEEAAQGQETLCDQDTVEDESTPTGTYLARQPDVGGLGTANVR